MTDVHARLSPSRAHRYMPCPGSVILEEQFPDESSVYADEGTAAHWLASTCLQDGMDAASYLGEDIRVGERKFRVTPEFAEHVQSYVDFVRQAAEGGTLLVEKRVSIAHLTGEQDAGGTADAIILFPQKRLMKVIDLKFGMGVAVSATRNPQAMKYGLGALHDYDLLGSFEQVELVIHQPRLNSVSSYVATLEELEAFATEVWNASEAVRTARIMYDDPGMDAKDWAETYLNPGEKQCQFCRAKATCPALADEVAEVVSGGVATAADFASLVIDTVDEKTSGNWLPAAMAKVGLVEDWCKAVRAEVERRLIANQPVDGFKLVQGKNGPRKWTDTAKAEAALKAMRLKQAEMYDTSLISPTTAEKRLKSNPKQWEKLQSLITQSEGRLSVAPVSDKRPAVTATATAEDFAGLVNPK